YLANAFPLLASFAKKWLNKAGGRLIVPIPLHSKRLRKRGFNQSLLLARQMSSRLATELDFLSLRRIKYT
ncbi:MAG: ComF family protein, partial [Desulfatiglandales bacterium]|nr:ComF family protein [Desulfatiglandales bacterium]